MGMRYILLFIAFFAFVGCADSKQKERDQNRSVAALKEDSKKKLREIKETGDITFIIRNAPAIYYEGPFGKEGFEYDLAKSFAKHLGVGLRLFVVYDMQEAITALKNHKGQIASASITKTKEREKNFIFGPSYLNVKQFVVCNRSVKGIKDISAFSHNSNYTLSVPVDTSYQDRLDRLSRENNITYMLEPHASTEEIMDKVQKGIIDCTVSDSNLFSINRRYYPNISERFPITGEQYIAWMLRDTEIALQEEIYRWYKDFAKTQTYRDIVYRYYNVTKDYDFVDNRAFIRKIKSTLPKYERYFKEAGKKYDIPWQILAAVSYKESHWNPLATSPTGVRGMMMLTNSTAEYMGISDRLNPKESIFGGAKYLNYLIKLMPDELQHYKQRYKYAMVAYNIGIGHLNDAFRLAQSMRLDPYIWVEFQKVIPLLSHEAYYKNLRHGYANGIGAQIYVNQILNFYDILINKESHLINYKRAGVE